MISDPRFSFGPVGLTPLPFPGPGPGPEPFPHPGPLPDGFRWPPERVFIPDRVRRVHPPATLKILVVTDSLSYSTASGFALGRFVEVLRDDSHPDHPDYAKFDVTTATRQSSGADINDFTFSESSLSGYDEVWLFGFGRGQFQPSAPREHDLSSSEIAALDAFMDNDGGVFATGDHEDLGLGLAAGVTRVKDMRRWYFSENGNPPLPPGENNAPDISDMTRIDTREPTVPGMPSSGSEVDATPQIIEPKRYLGPTVLQTYVHPVLCGPRGPITRFPDHAHEGWCEVPDSWDQDTFPGAEPEVIAWGTTPQGREKRGENPLESTRFGLLAAYDGHRGDKGRVVTDSTWHHWMNMNIDPLIAEAAAPGGDTRPWLDTAAYFRNVAVWLAPPAKQRAMRRAGTSYLRWRYPFIEEIPLHREIFRRQPLRLIAAARDAAGKSAPQCQALRFALDWLVEAEFDRLADIIDPWGPKREIDELPAHLAASIVDAVTYAALGGATLAAALAVAERGQKDAEELGEHLDGQMAKGARETVEAALEALHKQAEQSCSALKALR
jgi:hypothetical protein